MLNYLVSISTGFSIVSAVLLLIVYTRLYLLWNKPVRSILSAALLLICFASIQMLNWRHLNNPADLYASKLYSSLIILTAPAFYFFVRGYITDGRDNSLLDLLHLIPLVANAFVPNKWIVPISFMMGSVYAGLCVYLILDLQNKRKRFKLELAAIAGFLLIAVAVGLISTTIAQNSVLFLVSYCVLIGLSFFLVLALLLLVPDTAQNLNEAVEIRYAKSTLDQIDRSSTISRLKSLMDDEKLYLNERLSLSDVADQLDLSSHQLSELINVEFDQGFSHYIRSKRIDHAKRLLRVEPKASVLSVGLSSGFTSQSSFYTAFGQIVGQTPGKYRAQHLKSV